MATNNNGNFGQENRDDQQWNDNQDASNSTLNQNLNPRETDRTRYDQAESSAEQRMNNRNSDNSRDWNSDDLSATDRENEAEGTGFETSEDLDENADPDTDQARSRDNETNRNESL